MIENHKQKPREDQAKIRILLTNDDGIFAPGLYSLYTILKQEFEVLVVAPEYEMSAVGHAITLHNPIRVREIRRKGGFVGLAVTGTPADCVKLAIQELYQNNPPSAVISGINLGANVGVNVLYSGTVSAATEGAFLGLPSAAISLDTITNPDFTFAADFGLRIARLLTHCQYLKNVALNVNVPALPPEEILGIEFTSQGTGRFVERFEKRVDPRGNVYYWLTGETPVEDNSPYSDGKALKGRKISITPIYYDLTSYKHLEGLRKEKERALSILWPNERDQR